MFDYNQNYILNVPLHFFLIALFNLSLIICQHTVLWNQKFLYNMDDFQTDLFDP